jgi:hypothetical protein
VLFDFERVLVAVPPFAAFLFRVAAAFLAAAERCALVCAMRV